MLAVGCADVRARRKGVYDPKSQDHLSTGSLIRIFQNPMRESPVDGAGVALRFALHGIQTTAHGGAVAHLRPLHS